MKRISLLTLTAGLVVVALAPGCSNISTQLGGSDPLPVERHSSAAIELGRPLVTWRGDALELVGYVTPRRSATTTTNSQVHVELLAADGRVLTSQVVEFTPRDLKPRLRPPQPHGRYTLTIARPPRDLARVRIRAHDAPAAEL